MLQKKGSMKGQITVQQHWKTAHLNLYPKNRKTNTNMYIKQYIYYNIKYKLCVKRMKMTDLEVVDYIHTDKVNVYKSYETARKRAHDFILSLARTKSQSCS